MMRGTVLGTERMEGPFDGTWTCDIHTAQLTSFATTFLQPPELFLARRLESEPVLQALLRATDHCPRCRRRAGGAEDRAVGLSLAAPGETLPEVSIRVTCTHRPGGHWECSYQAKVKRKILLLGDVSSEKTDLVRPAVFDELSDAWRDFTGAKVMTRHETVRPDDRTLGFHVVFTLWDIAGHRFLNKKLLRGYFYGARAILAVCDFAKDRSVEELGHWLSVAERILGKREIVIVARGRQVPNPLPVAEARLRELSAKHHAVVVTIPPGDVHRLEHVFQALGAQTVRDVFGTERYAPMYA